jgi:hypothetical protein
MRRVQHTTLDQQNFMTAQGTASMRVLPAMCRTQSEGPAHGTLRPQQIHKTHNQMQPCALHCETKKSMRVAHSIYFGDHKPQQNAITSYNKTLARVLIYTIHISTACCCMLQTNQARQRHADHVQTLAAVQQQQQQQQQQQLVHHSNRAG